MHQKIKIPHKREVVTIDASMSKAVITILDSQKQVIAPLGFQVAGIFDGIEIDPRVIRMMEKMQYQPRFRLGKNRQGVPKLPNVKTQKGTKGLGYTERESKEGIKE